MKTPSLKFLRRLSTVAAALLMVMPWARSQTPPVLDLQLYAGLSITGAVGSVYAIQYNTNVAQTNAWLSLTNITLLSSPFLWVDTTTPATERRFYRTEFIQQPTPTNMVWIQPGTFTMGSPTDEVLRDEGETQHMVTLTEGFYIGKYLVTQTNYLAVIGYNPSFFTNDLTRPVESLTWYEATNYCAQLTQQEQAAGRLPTDWAYRLPTEAEWEYACRAGTTTPFSHAYDPNYTRVVFYAWYSENSGNVTHPVGTKLPNPWGLYDMGGNVWEHCSDWYAPLDTSSVTNPIGPASGLYHVVKGGGFRDPVGNCRSAARSAYPPLLPDDNLGIRVVLAPNIP